MTNESYLVEFAKGLPQENIARILPHLSIRPAKTWWIQLALVHRSFRESNDGAPQLHSLLAILRGFGTSLLNLVVQDYLVSPSRLGTVDSIYKKSTLLVPFVLAAIADKLRIKENAYTGPCVTPGEMDTVTTVVTLQIIGGLFLSEDYEAIHSLVSSTVQAAKLRITQHDSALNFKNLLQQHAHKTFREYPKYKLLQELGPDYNKHFLVSVTVKNGLRAEGGARSKKVAEQAAAHAWLDRYCPSTLAIELSTQTTSARETSKLVSTEGLSPRWHASHQTLSSIFGIPSSKGALLTEAVTHRSVRGVRDYSILAQLGSAVLEVAITELIFTFLFRQDLSSLDEGRFAQVRATMLGKSVLAELSKLVHLDDLLLFGPAQREAGITPSIHADAIQAVLAAAYTARRPRLSIAAILPDPVRNHMLGVVTNLTVPGHATGGAKSVLQDILRTLRLSVVYNSSSTGPAHSATYQATCMLVSASDTSRITVGLGTGTSKKAAETELATQIINILTTINRYDPPQAERLKTTLSSSRQLSKFLLTQELAFPAENQKQIALWWKYGFFGANALKENRHDLFSAWLEEVQTIVADRNHAVGTDLQHYLRQVRLNATAAVRKRYRHALTIVQEMVQRLDPETDDGTTRPSGYDVLLTLATITRLFAAPRTTTTLKVQLLDLAILIGHEQKPAILLSTAIPDITISEKDGTLLALLSSINESLKPHRSARPNLWFGLEPTTGILNIILGPLNSLIAQKLLDTWHDSLLWQFFREEFPINTITTNGETIMLRCGPFRESTDNSRAALIASYYRSVEYIYTKDEAELAARLLHDLKNTIIGYRTALAQKAGTPTQALVYKLQASKHRDSAFTLIASLDTIWGTLTDPVGTPIEPVQFIRSIIAEEYPSLPIDIRIIPPSAGNELPFITAPELLGSILRNLIKNAVEAMPMGGDIHIGATRDQRMLVLEISDEGPGMTSDQLQKILAGEPLASTKKQGSGLGLLTVQAMLRKIGGRLAATNDTKPGMRWLIELEELPDLQDMNGGA